MRRRDFAEAARALPPAALAEGDRQRNVGGATAVLRRAVTPWPYDDVSLDALCARAPRLDSTRYHD